MIIKTLITVLTTTTILFATAGEKIFTKHCLSCHIRSDVKGNIDRTKLKAPPMNRVSQRLKMMTSSQREFTAFTKEYIQNPSRDKGFCRPKAYNHFGVMPPIGKNLTKQERKIIARWLYNSFDSSHEKKRSCANEDQTRKCGAK